MESHIQIFDTTLRDGEQTPGVNFSFDERLSIAKQLEKWGVDVIEAGFPASSTGSFKSVEAISKALTTTAVCGLARCKNLILMQYMKQQNVLLNHVFMYLLLLPHPFRA